MSPDNSPSIVWDRNKYGPDQLGFSWIPENLQGRERPRSQLEIPVSNLYAKDTGSLGRLANAGVYSLEGLLLFREEDLRLLRIGWALNVLREKVTSYLGNRALLGPQEKLIKVVYKVPDEHNLYLVLPTPKDEADRRTVLIEVFNELDVYHLRKRGQVVDKRFGISSWESKTVNLIAQELGISCNWAQSLCKGGIEMMRGYPFKEKLDTFVPVKLR